MRKIIDQNTSRFSHFYYPMYTYICSQKSFRPWSYLELKVKSLKSVLIPFIFAQFIFLLVRNLCHAFSWQLEVLSLQCIGLKNAEVSQIFCLLFWHNAFILKRRESQCFLYVLYCVFCIGQIWNVLSVLVFFLKYVCKTDY